MNYQIKFICLSQKISQTQVYASESSQVKIVIFATYENGHSHCLLSSCCACDLQSSAKLLSIFFQSSARSAPQFSASFIFPHFPTLSYPPQAAYFDLIVHFLLFPLCLAPYIHQPCLFLSVSLFTVIITFPVSLIFLLSPCRPRHQSWLSTPLNLPSL